MRDHRRWRCELHVRRCGRSWRLADPAHPGDGGFERTGLGRERGARVRWRRARAGGDGHPDERVLERNRSQGTHPVRRLAGRGYERAVERAGGRASGFDGVGRVQHRKRAGRHRGEPEGHELSVAGGVRGRSRGHACVSAGAVLARRMPRADAGRSDYGHARGRSAGPAPEACVQPFAGTGGRREDRVQRRSVSLRGRRLGPPGRPAGPVRAAHDVRERDGGADGGGQRVVDDLGRAREPVARQHALDPRPARQRQ